MHRRRTIAFLLPQSFDYVRRIAAGAARRLAEEPHWAYRFVEETECAELVRRRVRFDGVVGYVSTPRRLRDFHRLSPRLVNVSNSSRIPMPVSRVVSDDLEVGRLAARHLLNLGFRTLHLLRLGGGLFAQLRAAGFQEAAGEAGVRVEEAGPQGTANRLRWLRRIERPAAIFAVNDATASLVVRDCARLGIRIPGEVAVLGVDNDSYYVHAGGVPLSSVELDAMRIGQWAGEWIIGPGGPPRPPATRLVPPVGVVARASTDTLHSEDPRLARALAALREHLAGGRSLKAIAARSGLSLRTFHRLMAVHHGLGPAEFQARLRVEMATRLLRQTRLPLEEIATRSGLDNPVRLWRTFKRITGRTPGSFRGG